MDEHYGKTRVCSLLKIKAHTFGVFRPFGRPGATFWRLSQASAPAAATLLAIFAPIVGPAANVWQFSSPAAATFLAIFVLADALAAALLAIFVPADALAASFGSSRPRNRSRKQPRIPRTVARAHKKRPPGEEGGLLEGGRALGEALGERYVESLVTRRPGSGRW